MKRLTLLLIAPVLPLFAESLSIVPMEYQMSDMQATRVLYEMQNRFSAGESFVQSEDEITDDEARVTLARILGFQIKEKQGALELYRFLIDKGVNDPVLWVEISSLYALRGEYGQALQALRHITAESLDTDGQVKLANLYAQLGYASHSCKASEYFF